MDKEEIFNAIENGVCKFCENYNNGEFSKPCLLCKVSQCYMTIELLSKANSAK